ncbi:cation diffusion facilitator family transporter [Staphylospora marina]|uniref:cation diffusion facilitator family transporter n=1 Tax=Staphylospora marina TaxID=2490858 RepID=UPI001F153A95|nr:cation diffusion facilitator family transporter [Staphylospora marina]
MRNGSPSAQRGAILGLVCYVVLAATKCWIGAKTGSDAVLSDGLNNVSDILLSAAILIGIRVASLPADRNHPFGHRKAETVAALVAASFMALVALEVWLHSVQSLFRPKPDMIGMEALLVSLAGAVVMFAVSLHNRRLGRKTGSEALQAAAGDNMSDALVSLGAAIGVWGARAGWSWMDPVCALIVGGIILRTAWHVGKPAIDSLMDGFEGEKLAEIENIVKSVDGIRQVRELRARRYGPQVHVEMTVCVDPHLSVQDSHALTERVEELLIGFERIARVHIHVEPGMR